MNGPILELLASEADWVDPRSVELFRKGAPLFGVLDKSGVGAELNTPDGNDPEWIYNDLANRNSRVSSVLVPVRGTSLHLHFA